MIPFTHRSTFLRSLIVLFALVALLGLPTIVLKYFIVFANSGNEIKNLVKFNTARMMEYPNITVCNPFYFHKGRMESE